VNITDLVTLRAYGAADVDDVGNNVITTLNSTPTAGGTGYTANDLLAITTGGTGGQCRVDTVSSGVVTAVSLVSGGIDYAAGSAKATAGGTGTGCTVNITTVSDTRSIPVSEVPVGPGQEAILLAAEQEARGARPYMTGSLERADQCYKLWLAECDKIKAALDN
jgi:hypothetical protein